MKNQKSLFIFFVSIVLLSFILIRFVFSPKKAPILVDSLSPRAQEFLADQTSDGTSSWTQVQFAKSESSSEEISENNQIKTDCFSFQLPFSVINPQLEMTESRCSWRAKILSPMGYIVVGRYATEKFEEDSGILLRRKETEKYQEETLNSSTFEKNLIFRSEEEVIVFSNKENEIITFSFNTLSHPEDITNEKVYKILESFSL